MLNSNELGPKTFYPGQIEPATLGSGKFKIYPNNPILFPLGHIKSHQVVSKNTQVKAGSATFFTAGQMHAWVVLGQCPSLM